jgi:hypothetical protein
MGLHRRSGSHHQASGPLSLVVLGCVVKTRLVSDPVPANLSSAGRSPLRLANYFLGIKDITQK